MKTVIDIAEPLLARAERHARERGKSLRELVEEGLRLVLDADAKPTTYSLPDKSVGRRGNPNPLQGWCWQDLRSEIYRGSARR